MNSEAEERPQEARKPWNRQTNFTSKTTGERRTTAKKKTPKLVEAKKS